VSMQTRLKEILMSQVHSTLGLILFHGFQNNVGYVNVVKHVPTDKIIFTLVASDSKDISG
jgi:hypothetical protein